MSPESVIRLASGGDLAELVRLEEAAFTTDRFTESQVEYLLTRAHGTILVLEADGRVAGAAYLLWRRSLRSGRLYNLVVDPELQGRGFGARLLEECEIEAARRRCTALSLEVRRDNRRAVAFYESHGYRLDRMLPDYYEDGAPGLRMVKALDRAVERRLRLRVPYYAQSLDFTCGPASLMMAFKFFRPELALERTLELNLWKEATLVFMTSGIGGTGPFGLALAAQRRGHATRVIVSRDHTPFFRSVRSPQKRRVIQLMHEDLERKAAAAGVTVAWYNFPFEDIASAMLRGMIPVVLVSTYRLSGDRAPHWVVVTGFDSESVYIHDPDLECYDSDRSRARNIRIPLREFDRMRRYGRDEYKGVILVGPPVAPARIGMEGEDL